MKRSIIYVFSSLVIIALLSLTSLPATAGPAQQTCGFTIPCPTETPSGGNGGGGGGGTGGEPTETPAAGEPTATPGGPTSTPFPTPDGGYLPTAEPCGTVPTATSFGGLLNVRSGPGTDYDTVYQMVYFETRPIVGQYEFGDWWQIRLDDGTLGWVKDSVVLVNGNTSGVPVVQAPELNGATPTPGPIWQPTPNISCTPLPTPTSTNTPSPTPEGATAEPTDPPTDTATAPAATEALAEEPAEEVAEQPAEEEPTVAPTQAPPTATIAPTITPAPVPGEEEGDEGGGSNALLLGGAVLVGLGALGFFFIGRRRNDAA